MTTSNDDGMGALGEQLRAMTAERRGDQHLNDLVAKPTPIGDAQPTFTRKQISDPEFWAANRDAILAAQRDGRITN